MKILLPIPLFALFALAACDSSAPDEAPPEAPSTTTPDRPAAGTADMPADEAPAALSATSDIPAAMQGRWGLTRADCEPGRDDAKGLMIVRARELEFYESVGTLDEITGGEGERVRAAFDFSGEGMTWERDMSLDLQSDGQVLVREEYGEDAAVDPLRYEKC